MNRPDDNRGSRRRLRTASSALAAIVVAFALGIFLNARAMERTAEELPFGAERTVRLALIRPVAWLSHGLLLDRPASYVAEALGRDDGISASRKVSSVQPRQSASASSGKPGRAPAERPLVKPYAGHPLHLYIAGDSLMGVPGMALVNASKRTRLVKPLLDYRISSGLVRPDFFDWPAQVQRQVAEFRPGAVVLLFGGNDNQAIQTPAGKVHQFAVAGWKEEYRDRIRQMLAVLSEGGVQRVYWIGLPPMSDPALDQDTGIINEIVRSEAKKHPGVTFIDGDLALSSNGRYVQYLRTARGKTEQVREGDGVHMTYAGGARLADLVLDAIRKEWLSGRKEAAGSNAQ